MGPSFAPVVAASLKLRSETRSHTRGGVVHCTWAWGWRMAGAAAPTSYRRPELGFVATGALRPAAPAAQPRARGAVASMEVPGCCPPHPRAFERQFVLSPLEEIAPDLIMVPIVAFDSKLNRIGYGKGYYDRMLKKIHKLKKKSIFLVIAHSFQKCKNIPTNKHDFKLDYIFTERGIITSN